MKVSRAPGDLLEALQQESKLALTRAIQADINRTKNISAELLDHQGTWITGWTNSADWINYGLIYGGVRLSDAVQHFPRTMQFLAEQPGVICMAGYSLLRPKASIPPHVDEDESSGARTWHLGIGIPRECYLTVGGEEVAEENGKILNFDDSLCHHVSNGSAEDRLLLYWKTFNENLQA